MYGKIHSISQIIESCLELVAQKNQSEVGDIAACYKGLLYLP